MNLQEIIKQYEGYDMTQGVETLLELRKRVVILMNKLSYEIGLTEEMHKELSVKKKIALATKELELDGTGQDRKNKALIDQAEIVKRDAAMEGKLKAMRIKFESMKELSNSMSSFLNKL